MKILNEMRVQNGLKEVKCVKYKPHIVDGYECFSTECFTNENLSYVDLPSALKSREKCSIQDVIHQFSYVDGFSDYLEFIILNAFLTTGYVDIYDVGFLCNEKNEIVSVAPVMEAVLKLNKDDFTPFTNTREELIEFIKNISWFDKDVYREEIIKLYSERYGDDDLFRSPKKMAKSLDEQLNKI